MVKLIIQIPCLNEAETLPVVLADIPQTIAGIDEIETLIIDDGSTDKSWEIICAYAERDTRIIPYQNQSNL